MKKWKWILAAVLASLLMAGAAGFMPMKHSLVYAAESKKVISVTGQGSLNVTPDVAYIQLGVETRAKTAAEAHSANAKTFQAVKAAIQKAGIKDQDVQTVQFNTYPQYTYSDKQGQQLTGYLVQNMIRITYRQLDQIGDLLDQLSAAGVNRVDQIQFGSEKMAEYERKALQLAIADAKAKAEAMAQAAGVKIKGVIMMNQAGAYNPPVLMREFMYKSAAEAPSAPRTEISAGQLKVEARVNVVYEF